MFIDMLFSNTYACGLVVNMSINLHLICINSLLILCSFTVKIV